MRLVTMEATEDGKRTYTHLYTAIRAGEVRGIEQIRRVGKIMKKLERLGVKEQRITKDAETNENVLGWRWRMQDDGGALYLEDAEHSELQSRMNQVGWHPDATEFVERTYDLLDKAPTVDVTKPTLVPAAIPPAESVIGQGDPPMAEGTDARSEAVGAAG